MEPAGIAQIFKCPIPDLRKATESHQFGLSPEVLGLTRELESGAMGTFGCISRACNTCVHSERNLSSAQTYFPKGLGAWANPKDLI